MRIPVRWLVRYVLWMAFVAALAAACRPAPAAVPTAFPSLAASPLAPAATATPLPLQLFEMPRDGAAPVLNAIRNARHAVDVEVYQLTDPEVIDALIAAHQAGRHVRVILNQRFFTGENPNVAAFERLDASGVAVRWAGSKFTYTHVKTIVVDAGTDTQLALIMTLNLGPSYLGKPDLLGPSLEFGIVDRTGSDVATIAALFQADWNDRSLALPPDTPLVVSPLNSRVALLKAINQADRSIHLFAQEFQDTQIVGALLQAAQRGVDVRAILAANIQGNAPNAQALKQAGGQARYLVSPYQHAKAMIVDGSLVYVGSINLTKTSLDRNRELGIMTRQEDLAAQMEMEFDRFWILAADRANP